MYRVVSEIVGRTAAYYVEKDGKRINYIFWTERSAQNCADELNQKDKIVAAHEKQKPAMFGKRRGSMPGNNEPLG